MDLDLLELSERQHGLLTVAQTVAAGWSESTRRHAVAAGDWVPMGNRVLRRRGSPLTKATALLAAVLDAGPGAALSHTTAAAWWGLPGFDLRHVHVTRRRVLSTPAPLVDRLHNVRSLPPSHTTVLDGVPVMRPERVAFELCATVHPERAARAIDAGWSRGLFSGASLRRLLDEHAKRGRKGTVVMRAILDDRPPGWVPPASGLESRVMQILAEAGLGLWRRQVDLGADRWCGRVDFLHEFRPLVLEVQSERYHAALLDREHDARRKAALEQAGFTVVEVWDTEVWHHREVVVDRVAAALRELVADPAARGTDSATSSLSV
jgi:very-short-patch-repair endonuclease